MSGRTPVNLWATTPALPGRYELHMSRLSVGEIWRMSPNAPTALVAMVLFKLFRLRHLGTPAFLDHPAEIRPIADDAVPARFREALAEASHELDELGFSPVLTYVSASDVAKPAVARAFLSRDGRILAQRIVAVDDSGGASSLKVVCFFTSGVDGESRFWTLDQPRDLDTPLESRIVRCPAPVPDVYARHCDELAKRSGPFPPFDARDVHDLIERDEQRFAERVIARGLYRRQASAFPAGSASAEPARRSESRTPP